MSRDLHICPRCCQEFFGDDWEEEYEMHTCTPPPKVFVPTEDNFMSAFCCFSHIYEMGKWPATYFRIDTQTAIVALDRHIEKVKVLTGEGVICPICGDFVTYRQKYCDQCGQKLKEV